MQINSIYEKVNWQYYVYQYRRHWLVEYGKVFNPETGEIGSQTFKEANPDWGWQTENGEKKWVDGIIFPSYYGLQYNDGQFVKDQQLYDYISGEYTTYSETRAREVETVLSHVERDFETYHGQWPATISDWEWMLDIFQRAVNEKFPDKGYAMALYQAGYVATGNLISSFGGTGGEWQKYDDRIVLGSDSSAFKTYVQTMNSWYQKGWIDKDFQSHTDLLWRTDEENVRQGYVGLYFGMNDQLFDGMDLGIGHTQGIYTEGMPYPINDKYGADENKYVIPTTLYAANWETDSIMVSTNAEKNGKDLAALFTMLDKAFTPEMAACKSWGLTSEMLAESQEGVQQLYKELGFPSGTSVYDPESKAYYRHEDALDIPIDDQYVVGARRMVGLEGAVLGKYQKTRDQYENYIFNFFPDKGFLTKSFYANLNDDQYQLYTDKLGQLRSSMTVDIPKFIKGEKNISDYDSWYSSLKSTLGLDNITRMLDNQYQKMKEK